MKLIFNKKNLILYGILFLFIFGSGLILIISNNVVYDIIAFVILVFGAMSIVSFDLAHPYVWFSFVFMLYSISYPILYLNGIVYDVHIYTKSLIFAEWLALVTFLIVVTPSKTNYYELKKQKSIVIPNKLILITIFFILLSTIYEISTGGYKHKSEIYTQGPLIVSIGFRTALLLLIIYGINLSAYALEKKELNIKLTTLVLFVIFLLVFFSGERDLIIRFFVILLFIYYILIKDSKLTKGVVILGIVSLLIIPILSKYKYFGLTGEKTYSDLNFFFDFLTSDFQSASKNLQILLLDESVKGKFKGSTFISSFMRVFNLNKVFNIDVISSIRWYNDTYFSPNRAGQGFTLVGDGYINFGYLGIIILFLFIGVLIRVLYRKSNKGIYYFVFYIVSIPIFMYSIRADLANILSPLIKQNLFSIIFLYTLSKILKNIKGYTK